MNKKETRKFYHDKRMALSTEVLADLQQKIFNQFLFIKLPVFENVLSYSYLVSKNEFDIGLINRYIHSVNPSAIFSIPKIMEGYEMDAILIDIDTYNLPSASIANQYGILEPLSGNIIEPLNLDIVFVPLLAFNEKGFRVGYGKGYYDRFLSRCRKDVLKIGFSFFEAEQSIDDIDNYDVPLNLCITPLNVYEF
ncbi:MAG: 5-formyltetrahydrofolate cyclo-ligase [Flavitalea sp.]